MKREVECSIAKVDDVVIIYDGEHFYKVTYKGSIFETSDVILLKLMKNSFVPATVEFDGCYVKCANFGDGIIASDERFDYSRLEVVFKNYDFVFRGVDDKDRLIGDEKIMLRLANVLLERDVNTFGYEVHIMRLMTKLLDMYCNDNSLISKIQKKCLKTKKVPVKISSGDGVVVSPYMFFKTCEMAMRYTTSPLDEFVRRMPCLPYMDSDSKIKRCNVSMNEIRENIYTAALYMERFL